MKKQKKSTQDAKSVAYREVKENMEGLFIAISQDNGDQQLIYLSRMIQSLQDAQRATLQIHGGITQ